MSDSSRLSKRRDLHILACINNKKHGCLRVVWTRTKYARRELEGHFRLGGARIALGGALPFGRGSGRGTSTPLPPALPSRCTSRLANSCKSRAEYVQSPQHAHASVCLLGRARERAFAFVRARGCVCVNNVKMRLYLALG